VGNRGRQDAEEEDIRQLMSHFSVGETREEDELRLTLQRRKASLLRQEETKDRKERLPREQGMDLSKLTFYPNESGVLRRRKKKDRSSLFKGLGPFEPWQLEE
jgi:hypothetical protein